MEFESLLIIVTTLLLAFVSSWLLLEPFFHSALSTGISFSLRELKAEKEMLLSQLEELEHEFVSERISREIYEQSKQELMTRATRCFAEIEAAEGSSQNAPGHP